MLVEFTIVWNIYFHHAILFVMGWDAIYPGLQRTRAHDAPHCKSGGHFTSLGS
jgi:hypothetical protein